MQDTWETGLDSVVVHVVMNDLGIIGSVVKTLEERSGELLESQRATLLRMIDDAVASSLEHLRHIAFGAR